MLTTTTTLSTIITPPRRLCLKLMLILLVVSIGSRSPAIVVASSPSSRRTIIDRPSPSIKTITPQQQQQRQQRRNDNNNEHFLSFIPLRRRRSSPNATITTESSSSSSSSSHPPSINRIHFSEIKSTTLTLVAIETALPFLLVVIDGTGSFLSWLGDVLAFSWKTIMCDGVATLRRFSDGIDAYLKRAEETNGDDDDGSGGGGGVMGWKAQMALFLVASAEAIVAIVFDKQHAIMRRTDAIKSAIGIRPFPPRQLFVVGACSRGLQLCTRIRYAFDPSVGVCGLINVGASWAKCRWVSRIVVGWGTTPLLWKVCGARIPRRPRKRGD